MKKRRDINKKGHKKTARRGIEPQRYSLEPPLNKGALFFVLYFVLHIIKITICLVGIFFLKI